MTICLNCTVVSLNHVFSKFYFEFYAGLYSSDLPPPLLDKCVTIFSGTCMNQLNFNDNTKGVELVQDVEDDISIQICGPQDSLTED